MGDFENSTRARLAGPWQSKQAFIEFVRAPQGNEGQKTIGDAKWSNKDLEPTPEEHRTWTW